MTTTVASQRRSHSPFSNAPVYVVALALAAVVIVPIAYVVISGFRTNGQLASKPVGLPHPWATHNYTKVIASADFWRMVGNSIIIAVIPTAIVVGVSALAAIRSRGSSSAAAS